MNARKTLRILLGTLLLGSLAAACSGGEGDDDDDGGTPTGFVTPTADPNAHPYVQEAQVQFPRILDLQVKVLSTTCSPNPNVCHNSSNFPNLETAGNTIANVGEPCNVELPDRSQGWNGCERPADIVRAGTTLTTRLKWVERVGPQSWRVGLEEAPNVTQTILAPEFVSADGDVLLSGGAGGEFWGVSMALVQGTDIASISVADADFIAEFVDSVLATVVGGDPNEDGIWGGDDDSGVDPGALFYPGSPERSYLWGRITGTVPGSRMPLANAPLSNAAYTAIACWIEGLSGDGSDDAEDLIDYGGCSYAQDPQDHEVQ